MSITTSLWKVALHSAAILHTCITDSGSSELTWNIGAFTTRATSGRETNYISAFHIPSSHITYIDVSYVKVEGSIPDEVNFFN
jgi:hypothetical protein